MDGNLAMANNRVYENEHESEAEVWEIIDTHVNYMVISFGSIKSIERTFIDKINRTRYGTKDRKRGLSNFVGVSLNKATNKWRSRITINGKEHSLGHFHTELEAGIAYQNKLKTL